MWHLLFSFQPRSSKEKPSGVCILLFTALHGNRIWCLPHLKSSSPHPSQGPLGEKHFPHILLMYLSSWLYLQVCFQNTARYNLHNLEAGILVQYSKVYIYIKMCLLFPAGIKVAAPCPSKPFMGFEGQGNGRTHSYFIAVAEDLAGLRTPQGKRYGFSIRRQGRKPYISYSQKFLWKTGWCCNLPHRIRPCLETVKTKQLCKQNPLY